MENLFVLKETPVDSLVTSELTIPSASIFGSDNCKAKNEVRSIGFCKVAAYENTYIYIIESLIEHDRICNMILKSWQCVLSVGLNSGSIDHWFEP